MPIVCTWKTDGSENCQQADFTESDDGNIRVDMVTTGGSPVNLLGTLSPSPPDTYWIQVRIVEMDRSSSISVGVALPSEFKQGYRIRGMFYNGNLTNGSAALKTSFGPRLHAGDCCTIECAHVNNGDSRTTFVMTVYLNGTRVGRGFEVAMKDDERFHPCIAIHGKFQLMIKITEERPDMPVLQSATHVLEGKWKIVQASKDDTGKHSILPVLTGDGSLTEERDVILTITPERLATGKDVLHLSVHVFNSMYMKKEYVASPDMRMFDLIGVCGSLPSTMMLAPPPYDRVEQELATAMVGFWQSLRLTSDNEEELPIVSSTDQVMACCVRQLTAEGAALTKY